MTTRGGHRHRIRVGAVALALLSAGCSGTAAPASPSNEPPATPSAVATVDPTPVATPTATPFELARCEPHADLIDPAPPDPTIPSLPIAASIALPEADDAFSVASAGGSIWVTDGIGGFIHRIDPDTASILASIAVGETGDMYLAATDDTLWMTGMRNWLVAPLDLASNAVGEPIDAGRGPLGVAIGPNGPLIVAFEDQALFEVDAVTRKASRTVALDPDPATPPDAGPTDVEVVGGDAWVLGHRGRMLTRVDLASFTVVEQPCVDLPSPERLAQGDGVLWISSSLDSTVARFDLATGQVDARVRLPDVTLGTKRFVWELSVDDQGDVWVAAHSFVARIDAQSLAITAWVDLRPLASHPDAEGAFDVRVVDGRAWISFSSGPDSKLVMVDVP